MKKLMLLLVIGSLAACGKSAGVIGPSSTSVTATASAAGVLPSWMMSYNGHLVRPEYGTYLVYAGPEITGKPELKAHLDQTIAAANALGGGRVIFALTGDTHAPITLRINANDPRVAPGSGVGAGDLVNVNYRCTADAIVIRDEKWFLTNVPLHELGHFLFGYGHSDTPEDIMNVNVRDYSRISFSSNEFSVWNTSLGFAPGTTF